MLSVKSYNLRHRTPFTEHLLCQATQTNFWSVRIFSIIQISLTMILWSPWTATLMRRHFFFNNRDIWFGGLKNGVCLYLEILQDLDLAIFQSPSLVCDYHFCLSSKFMHPTSVPMQIGCHFMMAVLVFLYYYYHYFLHL